MARDIRDVNVKIDKVVLNLLPEGGEVVALTPLGLSDYCNTLKIDVRLPDGTFHHFFEKEGKGPDAYELMLGHYMSETSVYRFIPDYVPRPLGFGTYEAHPDTHFFLLEYVDMIDDDLPPPTTYMAPVVQLHLKSIGKSPDNKFGFPVKTRFGPLPHSNDWETSWEVWWTKHMKFVLDREETIRGAHSPENMELKNQFLDKVLPRYLRPLEAGGRKVTPCLVHTDLWPGNVKYKFDYSAITVYDANGLWGHNEVELAIFWNPRYPLGKPYLKEYWKHVPISDPEEDAENRIITYLVRNQACLASMYPNEAKLRDIFFSNMRLLVNRVLKEEAEQRNKYNADQFTNNAVVTSSELEADEEGVVGVDERPALIHSSSDNQSA